MERDEAIRRQFDRAAAAYGTSPIFAQGHDLQLMVEAAAPTAAMRVLDVGCAAGHTALAFAPHVHDVIGVDLSRDMLVEATRQAAARGVTNVRWEEASAAALPYADATFDIVACRLVAHHFPSLAPPLTEMTRVAKPGGQLLIVDIISPESPALADFINRIEILRDPSHGRDWTLSEWEAAGKTIGVPLDVRARWDMPQEFAVWTARQQTPPEAIARLEQLMDNASDEARDAFSLVGSPKRAFQLWAALLRGVKE
ncbi:MAG: methyltransferase domain-containing protein [Thermomicrobia bacterium]|nr:methyltransferase domain-containing protein [Thermomicrobia bacterium]MCA1722706.1 methyltransferase domain-containing protein [Thermomicrobia bacterium]